MKTPACVFLLAFAGAAQANSYNYGKCPVAPNCNFSSNAINATAFSDTETFDLGNWTEFYGVYDYTSSLQVVVTGFSGTTPCSGRGCHGVPYTTDVTSATLDGTPMTQTSPGVWKYVGSLAPGSHTIAVTGTASGATWASRWGGATQGITYTLVPLPAGGGSGGSP